MTPDARSSLRAAALGLLAAAWLFTPLSAQTPPSLVPSLAPSRPEQRITRVRPDDPRLSYSEFVNAAIDEDRANFDRAVVPWTGALHSPGTRIAFATDATRIRVLLDYRATLPNPGAGLFRLEVDGQLAAQLIGSDTDTGPGTYPLFEAASSVRREFSLVYPYASNVSFLGLELSGGSPGLLPPPPPRPRTLYVAYGDSITHGFDGTSTTEGYPSRVGAALGERVINMGFFGRALAPADGTELGELGADRVSVAIGTNDWLYETPPATFTAGYDAFLDNIRAQQPTVPILAITPTWVGNEGVLNGLGLTREDYRQMIRDTVLPRAMLDDQLFLVEGAVLVPPGPAYFPDGIHPNDAGFVIYASGLSDANLVSEPGFEAGGFAWTDLGGVQVVSGSAHSGTSSLALGPGSGGAEQPVGRVRRDASYLLSGWCRTDDVAEPITLGIRFVDDAGVELSSVEVQASSATYELASLPVETPAQFARTVVYVSKGAGTAGGLVDDVSLEQVAALDAGDGPPVQPRTAARRAAVTPAGRSPALRNGPARPVFVPGSPAGPVRAAVWGRDEAADAGAEVLLGVLVVPSRGLWLALPDLNSPRTAGPPVIRVDRLAPR